MSLSEVSLTVIGATILALGVIKSGLLDYCGMRSELNLRISHRKLQFILIFSLLFLTQGALQTKFSSSDYLGSWHIVGGVIFGLGASLIGSCPLSLFYSQKLSWPAVLSRVAILIFFMTGVYLSSLIISSPNSFNLTFGQSFYLDQIFPIDLNSLQLTLGILLLLAFFKFSKGHFNLTDLIPAIFVTIGLSIAQYLNIGIGSIAGARAVIEASPQMKVTLVYQAIFFITVILTISFAGLRNSDQHMKVTKVHLISAGLMGLGGGLAGGCTLGAMIEGLSTLSISGIMTSLSILISFIVFSNLKQRINGFLS